MNLSVAYLKESKILKSLFLAFFLIFINVSATQAVDSCCPNGTLMLVKQSRSHDCAYLVNLNCTDGHGNACPYPNPTVICEGQYKYEYWCQMWVPSGCDACQGCCDIWYDKYQCCSPEICDGLDNDCDGQTDEGLSTDSDGDGHYTLSSCATPHDDCNDTNAAIHPGAAEICDGSDNNCDGSTDENIPPQSCYTGQPTETQGVGICKAGTQTCSAGAWGTCSGEITPQLELCDGIDNNCDGNKDEGCFVLNGSKPEHCVESSVNMASSNLSHFQSLFRTQNAVLPIDFELTYNSLDADGPMGPGWTHSYNISLVQTSSSEYTLIQGYGKNIVLVQNGSQYKPPSEAYPVLTTSPYKLTHRDGTVYNFDTSGKLTSIQDRYSNTLSFTYTGSNLTGISDSQNTDRTISLTYLNGKIETITDPNNNVHVFSYLNGYLTGLTTQTPDTNDTDPVWAYTYKPYGYMWTKTDPRNYTVTYVYDENDPNHRLLNTIDPENPALQRVLTFDPVNTTSTVTEKDGGVWIYKYDALTGRLTEKTIPEGYTPLGNTQPQDYIITYTYQTTPEVKEIATDSKGDITESTYDNNGNLWKVTEKSSTDPVGKTTIYTYDPTTNDILTITDPENNQTIYTYETISGERIIKIKDPANEETEYRYYADGRLKHIKNPKNQTTTFTYSYDSQTKKTTETITDFLGVSTKRIYDISGNMIESRDQFDIPTKYEYDSLNRLKYARDYQDNILYTYEHYADGNIKKVTDANGNWMEYKYNYKGKVTEVKDKLGNTTIYEYGTGCSSCGGGGDNLVKIKDANMKDTKFEYYKNGSRKNQTSPKGLTTSFTYDPPGFMASLTDPSSAITTFAKTDLTMTKTDPLGKTTIYEYDKAGKLKNVTDRNNKITHYTYTTDGVIDTITYDYPNGPTVTFANDELDRITSMTDSLGTTTYDYSDYDTINRILTVTDPHGFVVVYKYDAAWRLKELTYPGNKKVVYGYDAKNRLETVRLDWLTPAQTTTYSYDSAGRLDYTDNFNGTITDYGYDDANRLSSLINKKSDETIIASYVFPAQPEGLDAIGNIKKVIQTEPLEPVFTTETTNYTYNATKTRLLSAGSDTFTYDNEGQLATGYGSTFTFDYEHRLTAISGNFNAQYFYDATGNRLKATRNGTITKYIYDINGNLLAEADGSGNITKYYVHGLGLMALVTPSDSVYTYHFNNVGSTIAITDSSQNMVNKYSYDPFGAILNQVEAIAQPFKYVGRYGVMAEPNGFYYMITRYLDSKAGIFTSEDTIGFAGGDANLKRYVGNSPLIWIDPSGLHWLPTQHPAGFIAHRHDGPNGPIRMVHHRDTGVSPGDPLHTTPDPGPICIECNWNGLLTCLGKKPSPNTMMDCTICGKKIKAAGKSRTKLIWALRSPECIRCLGTYAAKSIDCVSIYCNVGRRTKCGNCQ